MNKKLVFALSAALLGGFGLPAWSQSLTHLPPSEEFNVVQVAAETPAPAPKTPVPAVDPSVTCGPSCADNAPLGSVVFGGGLYFMTPYFQSNAAFIERHTSGSSSFINQTDFSQNMQAAPLVWLGYVLDNGWGVRARWFDFNSNANASATSPTGGAIFYVPGGAGSSVPAKDLVAASEHLGVNVIDFEATNNFKFCNWSILASAGIRYAHISQSYDINEVDPFIVGARAATVASVTSSNDFNGAGPTMGVEVRRAIGDTDFAFYGSARGSILFGSSHQQGQGQFNLDPVYLSGSQATLVSIGELEIGGEWSHDLGLGRVRLVAQVGLVGQIWWGAGNASDVQSLFTLTNSTTNIHSAIPAGGNFGFIGGVGRFGIEF